MQKKIIKAIIIAALVTVSTLTLVGCGLIRGEMSQELVGTWLWNSNPNWMYVFFEGGTGERGFYGEKVPFTWSTSGIEVRIRCEGCEPMFGVRTRVWGFSVVGPSLRFVCPQDYSIIYEYTYYYEIGEIEPALLGTWLFDNYTNWSITFSEDGIGRRGTAGDTQLFVWGIIGDTLNIRRQGYVPYYYARNEMWRFSADSDTLRLEWLLEEGRTDYYTRAGALGDVNPALVGTWALEEDTRWRYVFNNDGTGTLGWTGELTHFNWGVVDDVIRIGLVGAIHADTIRHQRWFFSIEEDTLTMRWMWDDSEYVYIRHAEVNYAEIDDDETYGTDYTETDEND
ncbi:MAG: DUF5640 domain-containing protein [Firmicutes bacterium]|nr:DUF5640 domain-containing protein [Bacillota bacterium]